MFIRSIRTVRGHGTVSANAFRQRTIPRVVGRTNLRNTAANRRGMQEWTVANDNTLVAVGERQAAKALLEVFSQLHPQNNYAYVPYPTGSPIDGFLRVRYPDGTFDRLPVELKFSNTGGTFHMGDEQLWHCLGYNVIVFVLMPPMNRRGVMFRYAFGSMRAE